MVDIISDVAIQGTPQQVYDAIATEQGIRDWWALTAKGGNSVGEDLHVEFYGGQVHFIFDVSEQEAGKRVKWDVKQGAPGWDNTEVTFDINAGENGMTNLVFGHRNFGSYDPPYGMTNFNWNWYLISLKDLIEKGKGHPNDPAQEGS